MCYLESELTVRSVIRVVYHIISYGLMVAAYIYLAAFLTNYGVPKSIDSGVRLALTEALLIDVLLITLFALLHSGSARPWFRERLGKVMDQSMQRSTYLLISSVLLFLLFCFWEPIGGHLWTVDSRWVRALFWFVFGFGFLLLFAPTFVANRLRLKLFGNKIKRLLIKVHTRSGVRASVVYGLVRHPFYIGWLLIFWATPDMSAGHLVFAILLTGYVLVFGLHKEPELEGLSDIDYASRRREESVLIP